MSTASRWGVGVVMLAAALQLTGCAHLASTEADEDGGPAKVEHLDGDEPARVTLTESAMKRLDITTDMVLETQVNGETVRVIPYAAILYDTEGHTWVYVSPSPGVFVRHAVTVDRIVGNQALLSGGLAPGASVVVVGAEELYGSETEFEEE